MREVSEVVGEDSELMREDSELAKEVAESQPRAASESVRGAAVASARGAATLTVALAKGRMQHDALALLRRAGVRVCDDAVRSRRLAVEDEGGRFRFVFVKPSDVPVYVEHGVADCGVVGRDVLLEADADLLQPLDLGIGRCRLVVAAPRGRLDAELFAPRVATKYPRVAAAHFGARGTPVEIIALSGSVELAPLLGLADCIVDLVETGRTLAENGLEVVETIAPSSGRLVVNRASYQLKAAAVAALIDSLRRVVGESEGCAEGSAEGRAEEVAAGDGGGGRL